MNRSIDEIVASLRYAKKELKTGGVLLVGAGCSATAGIPLAAEFVEEIRREHRAAYERAAPTKSYPDCMKALLPGVRQQLIAHYVDKVTCINWAHVCIAALLKHGFVDRILTTNFDNLIVRACALLGEFPAVYDLAVSPTFKPAVIPPKAVFHLHGQHTGFVMKNTLEEVDAQAEVLRPVFEDIGRKRPWIVVGYSGLNDPVFKLLAEVPRFEFGLDWVGFGDREPDEHVRTELLDDARYAYYVRGYDADSFFVTLAQQLSIFPPDVVARPFSYMQELLGKLTEWRSPGHWTKQDVVGPARDALDVAIRQFEQTAATAADVAGTAAHAPPPGVLSASHVFNLQMAGDYRAVLNAESLLDEPTREKVKDAIAWAHTLAGDELCNQAASRPAEEGLVLLEAAARAYEAALRVKPDLTVALNNLGNTLAEQAKRRKYDPQFALTTLQHAAAQFEEALQVNPHDVHALDRLGNVLIETARISVGDEADQLLRQAAAMFEAALEIQPGAAFLLNNWGEALFERAKLAVVDDPERCLEEAADKHRQALESKPDDAYALGQWGNCLAQRATAALARGSDQEAMRHFAAAAEKYEKADQLQPGSGYVLNRWGIALFEWGALQRGEEAMRLLLAAADKHRRASEVHRHDAYALERLGEALLQLGWRSQQKHEAEQFFQEAVDTFERALRLRPRFPQWFNNLGCALFELGRLRKGADAERYLVEAAEHHREAYAINPRDVYALDNWGKVLMVRAGLHGDDEAEPMLLEAIEKHRAALELHPRDVFALCQWGDALVELARRVRGPEAERLLAEALERFHRAAETDPANDRARDSLTALAAWAAARNAGADEGAEDVAAAAA
ncbi:MAG TPA: hypothetical protein VF541_20030 [Longimicrobium sp.]